MRFISARGRSGRSGKWRSPWRWPQQQRRGCRRRGLRRPDMRRPLHHCNGRRRHCHGLWRGHWQHRSLHLQLAVLCHRQVHRHRAERRSAARLQRRVERHRGMRQHGQGQQQRPYPPGNVQGKTAHHRANVGAKNPKNNLSAFRTSSAHWPVRWCQWTAYRPTNRPRIPTPTSRPAQSAHHCR